MNFDDALEIVLRDERSKLVPILFIVQTLIICEGTQRVCGQGIVDQGDVKYVINFSYKLVIRIVKPL